MPAAPPSPTKPDGPGRATTSSKVSTSRTSSVSVERISTDGLDKGALIARKAAGHETDWKLVYDVLEVMGKGSFGSVMRIQHKTTKDIRVCKTVDTAKLKPAEVTACLLEIKALQRLDHPHIVRLYEFSLDRQDKKLYLILEALTGGDCKKLVRKPYKVLLETFVSKIVRHTLMATAYCHSMGVVHRDMKPENVMLTSPDWDRCVAKVIDFGLSAMFDAGRAHVIHQVAGTVHFMAPEVISRQPFGDPADVWAIGAMLYQLLCGLVPFDGRDVASCRDAICKNSVKFPPRVGWDKRSQESRDLIRQLLTKDPSHRLLAVEALDHGFITNNDNERVGLTKREKRRSVGGLQSFNEAPHFIRATLLLTAVQLSPEDLGDIERMFAALDLDRDGFITAEDLREVLQEPHAEENPGHAHMMGGSMSLFSASAFSHLAGPDGSMFVQQIVDTADLNCNGVIDFSEFVAACLHSRLIKANHEDGKQGAKDILRSAFDCFDSNSDGQVTEGEIMRMLDTPQIKRIEQHTGIDYKDVLREMPRNFSFTFDEFFDMIMSNIAPPPSKLVPMLPDTAAVVAADEEFEHGNLQDYESLYEQSQIEEAQQQRGAQQTIQEEDEDALSPQVSASPLSPVEGKPAAKPAGAKPVGDPKGGAPAEGKKSCCVVQ
eukprot:CAMPEP_0204325500 /NCGR_PEP_ID=MMETSP0469-20131031/11073_1 /ASSEMBLY_ACC=CAM_ASM_000384 /TAXON_ID=2969 /ORGANISM="Oxyrrhis marina" /LENGTH=658 /DNA_ID=CAMNT_0051307365 /DNA_START=1 /DNA_END=1977 /DNA_ORIENTATION=+